MVMMGTNDKQLDGGNAPQLRVYWGDEQDVTDRCYLSDSMRHAQRAWARMEVYRANLYPSGRLSELLVA
jgi:hypothetical protein